MKLSLVCLSLLLISSCGKIPQSGLSTGLNLSRSYNPVSVSDERLTRICQALSAKATNLAQAPSETLTFDISEKGCDDAELLPANPPTATVTISPAPDFHLLKTDGSSFIFPEAETNQTGIMKELCGNLSELTNPQTLSNGLVLSFKTTGISSGNCNAGSNETCLLIEMGPKEGENFTITTQEWIKFRTEPSQSRYGHFSDRRTISSAGCALNKFRQIKATLR